VVVYGPVPAALAHAELLSSTPPDGARVAAAPPAVTLTFSDPIDAQFVRVAVTTPAGTVPATATASGPRVTVPVPAAGPGAYRVVYRVVSADGHPVSGQLAYTVVAAPPLMATAASSTGPSASAGGPSASAGGPSAPSSVPAVAAAASPVAATGDGAGGWSTGAVVGGLVAAGAAVAVCIALLARIRRREGR